MGCKPAKCCCRKDADTESIGSITIDNAKPIVGENENPQDYLDTTGHTNYLQPTTEPQFSVYDAVANDTDAIYDEAATETGQTEIIHVKHKPSLGYVNVGYSSEEVPPPKDRLPSEKEKTHQPVMNELSRALQSRTVHINQ